MQVHWVETETGEICRRQLKRGQVLEFFARRAPAVVAMVASAARTTGAASSRGWATRCG
jgi:hypothetical protein